LNSSSADDCKSNQDRALLQNIEDIAEVAVDDLHVHLGFPAPLIFPDVWRDRAVRDWTIESDDCVLRYLFRHSRPARHLEFGTWEGDGVLRCVEECFATVWTINLLEGETLPDGQWAYSSEASDSMPSIGSVQQFVTNDASWVRTDAYGMIGHKYLERSFGGRVCQIYSDSREWDISQYPAGFFDSAFIDGGHAPDVVMADTTKAIPLVRSNGLMMWHDFCPLPEALELSAPARGVVAAIGGIRRSLAESFQKLFWIRPSWLLIGVRR